MHVAGLPSSTERRSATREDDSNSTPCGMRWRVACTWRREFARSSIGRVSDWGLPSGSLIPDSISTAMSGPGPFPHRVTRPPSWRPCKNSTKDVPHDREGDEGDREGKLRERGLASARTGGIEDRDRDAPSRGQERQAEDESGTPA